MRKKMMGMYIRTDYSYAWEEFDEPIPTSGEVLVQVEATTLTNWDINFLDRKLPQDAAKMTYNKVKTGIDVAGTVITGGSRFAKGAQVFGAVRIPISGNYNRTHAQYVAIPEKYLAIRPDSIKPDIAAVAAISGESALALSKKANFVATQKVLIIGASGAVGVLVTQLALHAETEVTVIGNELSLSYFKKLGVKAAYDYNKMTIDDLITKMQEEGTVEFDTVIDLVGGLSINQIKGLVDKKGTFVTALPWSYSRALALQLIYLGIRYHSIAVWHTTTEGLTEVANLINDKVLKPKVFKTFKIDSQFGDALKAAHSHKLGKIVLTVPKPTEPRL